MIVITKPKTYDEMVAYINGKSLAKLEVEANELITTGVIEATHNGSAHNVKVLGKEEEHRLDVYNMPVAQVVVEYGEGETKSVVGVDVEVFYHWKYCPYCKTVRSKSIVGYHNKDNRAYVREIMEHGNPVGR